MAAQNTHQALLHDACVSFLGFPFFRAIESGTQHTKIFGKFAIYILEFLEIALVCVLCLRIKLASALSQSLLVYTL